MEIDTMKSIVMGRNGEIYKEIVCVFLGISQYRKIDYKREN